MRPMIAACLLAAACSPAFEPGFPSFGLTTAERAGRCDVDVSIDGDAFQQADVPCEVRVTSEARLVHVWNIDDPADAWRAWIATHPTDWERVAHVGFATSRANAGAGGALSKLVGTATHVLVEDADAVELVFSGRDAGFLDVHGRVVARLAN